jgi:hypothetical protein
VAARNLRIADRLIIMVSVDAEYTQLMIAERRSDTQRFAMLAVMSLQEDFHPQVDVHAGAHQIKRPGR